jgi:hypothetical protein
MGPPSRQRRTARAVGRIKGTTTSRQLASSAPGRYPAPTKALKRGSEPAKIIATFTCRAACLSDPQQAQSQNSRFGPTQPRLN